MKTLNNIRIIGIDHGYGNIKTANTITPTGVIPSTIRPAFGSNILRCDGMYYSCGEGHKAFVSDKASDNDYYWLTLMGAAKELRRAGISEADVYLAAGLPLTWVKSQRGEFTNYLMRNERVEFEFNDRLYKLRFVGCSVFPQGYTAVIDRLSEMRGVNMLADIGNGTMNIMYITNSRPVTSKCWTEKLGVNQCVIRAANAVMDRFGMKIDESIIESVLRYGKADISEKYLACIRSAAREYSAEILDALRKYEYNPELMRLYVAGGGSCIFRNFVPPSDRISIISDICATAKGYETLALEKIQKQR